jgi:hypothetical protein
LENTNFCWCEKHYEKKGVSFVKKVNAKKVSVITCKTQPIQVLSEKLFTTLDTNFKDFLDVSEVLIENQPSLMNSHMKTVAVFLYSYFVMRGIIEKTKTGSKIESVRFVSPSNKLKVNSKNSDELLKKEKENNKKNTKNVYKLTKSLGVKYCQAIICEKDNETLNKVKKKDDMADSFLQGFQYLFTPVPEKYFKKLELIGFEDPSKKNKTKNKNTNENEEEINEKPKKISKVGKKKDILTDEKDDEINEKPKKVIRKKVSEK